MPEGRHPKGHHRLLDAWFDPGSHHSGLNVVLKPLVNLVVPKPHHLDGCTTCLEIYDVDANYSVPCLGLLLVGDTASDTSCVRDAPGGVVHESLAGHCNEIVDESLGQVSVFEEILGATKVNTVTQNHDEDYMETQAKKAVEETQKSWVKGA